MTDQDLLQDARGYLALLHKRRGLVITCICVSVLVAVVYNYTTRPLYQATCEILIERETPNVLPTKVMEIGQGGNEYFQTQFQLLQGRSLAEAVVRKLDSQWSVESQTGPLMSPWERFQRRFLGRVPPMTVGNDGIPLSPAAAAFQSRLSVEPIQGSRLVNLRFTAYNPNLAAQAVNLLAQLYIEQALDFRFTTSSEATDWLSERLREQKKKVEDAERALQEYREREGLVNFEERQSLADQNLQAFAAAAMNARTERIAKETLYSQMRSLPTSQLETFPLVMSNAVVQGLQSHLSELQRDQSRLSETLGDKHPDMVRVRSEAKATEDKLRAEMQNIVRSAESDYRTALQQEANLQVNLEAAKKEALEINRKAIEFGVLKREVDSNQQLFRDLMNRSKETGLESELKSTNIRIVEKALLPRSPISPQRTRNYEIALVLGLLLGVGLALLFEHADNTLKTPDDVKTHLNLPFLGMVPDVSLRSGTPGQGRTSPLILKNPNSAVGEAYRVLRTNLIFSSAQDSGRAILISSANPSEGKTTTVSNLAGSLAQNGARVLAVDADLRRPTLHQQFGVPKTPGLSDLIVGKCQASQAIQSTRFKGLQVLPCGYISPNPAELLGSANMKEVLRALRQHYDWVIIDTPPILAMADTSILCPLVDGVVLVVAAEASGRPAIRRAIDQITSVGGRFTGVVLNRVNLERNSYYYTQYYGEYYRSYYAEGTERQSNAPATQGPRPFRRS
jgi:succinoglycan biosynthesis transport protein ExoP